MTKNKIIFSTIAVSLGLFLLGIANAQVSESPIPVNCIKWYDGCNTCSVVNGETTGCTEMACQTYGEPKCLAYQDEHITDQWCDAMNRCPSRLECYSFPGIGLRCAQPNPCSYFECPQGTQCVIAESYPGRVMCQCVGPERPAVSNAEEPVSYDLQTQTVIHTVGQGEQPVSHDISLWKTTLGNKGILETTFASVEYSNELTVKESKLFMKTSVGEKPINVMPEDAVAVSETPNVESIKKIELKEEAQKPIYSVKGIKRAKLFFFIPISIQIETKISAESGSVVSIKKPWWSFLAR